MYSVSAGIKTDDVKEKYPLAPDLLTSHWFNSASPLTLPGLRGQVVVLHFFQMLCPGCVKYSVPQAEHVHRLQISDDLTVVGVHSVFEHHDAMTTVVLEAFLHEYQISHPIAVDVTVTGDPIPATMRQYRLKGTPSLILIDKKGRIRDHEFGRTDDVYLGVRVGQLLAEALD